MGKPHGILVSGWERLAAELAAALDFCHVKMDGAALPAASADGRGFVLSVPGGWVGDLPPQTDLVVVSKRGQEAWMKGLPCPGVFADSTEDPRALAAAIAARFYVRPGDGWRVSIAPLGALETYRFTVIFAVYDGKWLYARHQNRATYETAGGHIEPGETPLDCAKRELHEETGALAFSIVPAFDYAVHRDAEFSYGQVFFAQIETLGPIPQDSEMEEIRLFDGLPERMTYPAILPVIYARMQPFREALRA